MLISQLSPPVRLRKILGAAFYLLLCARLGLPAAQILSGVDEKKVVIRLENSFLDEVPERGILPLHFQIRNKMDQPGKWTFHFAATQGWSNKKQLTSERVVEVDARSVKTVRWDIPVFPNSEFHNGQNVNLEAVVNGPGVAGIQQRLLHGNSGNYGNVTPMVAISPELRITRDHWNYAELEKQLGDRNSAIRLAGFDLEAFPVSVSGLSGVDILLMTQTEWEGLRLQQPVMMRWISGGGQVWLVSDSPGRSEDIGVGHLKRIPFLTPPELVARLKDRPSIAHTLWDQKAYTRSHWELAQQISAIKNSFGWIMLAVIVIAALLGPVNIWFSLRKRNSMQVIWTTPLISLALSLLVALGIVFSDGFGGKGARSLHILLVPEHGVEILVQEQISRTGVLLNDRFTLPGETGIHMVYSGQNRKDRRLNYEQLPNDAWSGDWFENRSIQAQVLRRNRSSRAEVILKKGESPRVLSTVDATFTRMLIRDDRGEYWMAENLSPGGEQPLRKADKAEAQKLIEDLKTRNEMLFPHENALKEEGWFYAESAEQDRYLDTLSSIRWQDRPVWFLGPLTLEGQP